MVDGWELLAVPYRGLRTTHIRHLTSKLHSSWPELHNGLTLGVEKLGAHRVGRIECDGVNLSEQVVE